MDMYVSEHFNYKEFSRYFKLKSLIGEDIESNILYDTLISIKGNMVCSDKIIYLVGNLATHYTYKYNDIIIVEFIVNKHGNYYNHSIRNFSLYLIELSNEFGYNEYNKDGINDFVNSYIRFYLEIDRFRKIET